MRWRLKLRAGALGLGCLLLVVPAPVSAQQTQPAETWEQVKKAFAEAENAWVESLRSEDKQAKLPPHPAPAFAPRVRAAAERLAGRKEALEPLLWLLQYANTIRDGSEKPAPDCVWAVERLTADFAADPALEEELSGLVYSEWGVGPEPLIKLFDAVYARNPSREARATALLSKAVLVYQEAQQAEDDKQASSLRSKARELFVRVGREFADTAAAERSSGYVFEIDKLQVGMRAPDFAGQDVKGREIRLSQFRGNVVVVAFWGHW